MRILLLVAVVAAFALPALTLQQGVIRRGRIELGKIDEIAAKRRVYVEVSDVRDHLARALMQKQLRQYGEIEIVPTREQADFTLALAPLMESPVYRSQPSEYATRSLDLFAVMPTPTGSRVVWRASRPVPISNNASDVNLAMREFIAAFKRARREMRENAPRRTLTASLRGNV
ncbi:MAG TPA: hypothetical protein VF666_17020 [Pyrinomonadaceae bacterium]|jgi:hypothetical protein